MPQANVICVGNITIHLVSRLNQALSTSEKVSATYEIDAHAGILGAAMTAASDGAHVHLIGRVGRDAFADLILGNLHRRGVNTTFVRSVINSKTPLCLRLAFADGGSNEVRHVDAACSVSAEDILAARGAFLEADTLLLDDNLDEMARETAKHLAAKYGLTICSLGSPLPPLPVVTGTGANQLQETL